MRNRTEEEWKEHRKVSDEMADFIFNLLTKVYSDRLWLVMVYDYMHKIDDDGAKIVSTEQFEYRFFQDAILWSEAAGKCQEWGEGKLASFSNEREFNQVKELIGDADETWVGGK